MVDALLFDRLKAIRDLLDKIRGAGFDFDKIGETLGELGKAIEAAVNAPTLADQVKAWLHVLEVAAVATPTTTDDKLVASLKKLSESKVATIVFDLVAGWLGKSTPRAMAAAEADATAQAIDLGLLWAVAKMIYDLIQAFRKK